MKVFKFGGASVKDAEGVRNVAKVLAHFPQDDLLIVVSAMGKTTNALEEVVWDHVAGRDASAKVLRLEQAHAAEWRGRRVRKMLVFLDPIARASFGPKAWANQAWEAFGIETHVCAVPDVHRLALIAAQGAQDLRTDG